jgi:hypothetical protein
VFTVNESKIELTERLRREGRWEEATLFKDAKVKELRAGGMTRADAAEEAWRLMAAQYPPLANIDESAPEAPDATAGQPWPPQRPRGTDHDTEPDIDVDALLERIGDGRSSDLIRDTLWAYEHLANRSIKASDAPSCGAWALLEWAREYRNRFFEQVLPKAMLNKPPEEEENIRHEKRRIEEIERILKQFEEGMDEELRADVPGVLQQRVRDMLSNWVQQYGVSIPADARTHLDSAIVGLIRDSMRAVAPTSGGE